TMIIRQESSLGYKSIKVCSRPAAQCTFLLIVLVRTTSTDYTRTSFFFHTPQISIALRRIEEYIKEVRQKLKNNEVR
ncbi:hypothetical protein, partial [Vibrio vulnificus]|uniref:hypothetical protein n=1 Tax=Vibrio vulnificus TaxID=672 RepID=UPI003568EA1F